MDDKRNGGGKVCLVDFITEIPNKNTPEYQEQVDQAKRAVANAMRWQIEEARKKCKEFKLKYDEDRDAESWAGFCEWRGKVAGLVSGEKKQKEQAEKLVYLFELLAINRVPQEQITYSLIQFVSKQLDGRSLDKEKCLELRSHYKPHKAVYQVPEDKRQLWAAIKLNYSMVNKSQNGARRSKI
ncbi:hypothetical protein C6P74_23950 [Burkholderia multivorans]|uniref:hypothetical protein n=1 Tax=Burkholderia multivorans TaxID=87883 RepID=UPI000CFEA063|nr:hypothetical protein [Burkholderia multivorans]PRD76146.1 hypothetical protein C6P74_23950 [Burkholderia multivorans]